MESPVLGAPEDVSLLTIKINAAGKIPCSVAKRGDQRVAARPDAPAAWRTSGRDTQVFVDDSGRRALGVRLAGFALAAVWAFWLAGLAVGMTGFSDFPATGLPRLAITHSAPARLARAEAVADRSAADTRDAAAALRADRLDAVGTRQAASARTTAPCPPSGSVQDPSSPSGKLPMLLGRDRAAQSAGGPRAHRQACRPRLVTVRSAASSRLT